MIRLADYIANFLVEHGVSQGFTVIGGGAMHLNDAFGHKAHLKMLYNHHEQASGIAADCYARINNKPALLCVTTGPGGINALNGVASAYLDSVPMIVVSGQVRYDTSARYEKKKTGAVLRSMGDQEFDIVTSVKNMTKYAVSIENPNDIRFELERSFHLATTGRMGPVWIDVPVNFQGMMIEDSKLKSYFGSAKQKSDDKIIPSKVKEIDIKKIVSLIAKAKRPVIYPGFGNIHHHVAVVTVRTHIRVGIALGLMGAYRIERGAFLPGLAGKGIAAPVGLYAVYIGNRLLDVMILFGSERIPRQRGLVVKLVELHGQRVGGGYLLEDIITVVTGLLHRVGGAIHVPYHTLHLYGQVKIAEVAILGRYRQLIGLLAAYRTRHLLAHSPHAPAVLEHVVEVTGYFAFTCTALLQLLRDVVGERGNGKLNLVRPRSLIAELGVVCIL